jgi:group I intron endonuclease
MNISLILIITNKMERYGTIYCITNIINGKRYIGATSHGYEKRWKQHLSDARNDRKNGCSILKNGLQEFGEDNFKIEALLLCNLENLDMYENQFIQNFNTLFPFGYNMKTAGSLGCKLLNEVKIKIGNAHRGKVVSEKTKELTGRASKYRNMSIENKNVLKVALKKLHLENLPMYIVYSIDKRSYRNVEIIEVKVPKKKNKKFSIRDMKLEEKIRLAIQYKNSLTATVVGSSQEELKV